MLDSVILTQHCGSILVRKIHFFCLLLLCCAVSADEERAYLGGGGYYQTQPYEGADPLLTPTPVGIFDNKLFYIRWARLGLYFAGGDNWGLSLTAQPRPFGYEPSDSQKLQGMEQRETSFEGGLAFSAKNDQGFAELVWFHDLLDNSNGDLVRAEVGRSIDLGRWSLVPSLLIGWFSDDFNNYYYGVQEYEATTERPAYQAGAGINLGIQSYLMYDLSESWHLLGNLRADYLNAEITDSPMVADQWMISGMLSLLYSFGY